MDAMDDSGGDDAATDGSEDIVKVRTELEGDIMDRVEEGWPAATSKGEMMRRAIERGVLARERDKEECGEG